LPHEEEKVIASLAPGNVALATPPPIRTPPAIKNPTAVAIASRSIDLRIMVLIFAPGTSSR
jgi:hypothetical protein